MHFKYYFECHKNLKISCINISVIILKKSFKNIISAKLKEVKLKTAKMKIFESLFAFLLVLVCAFAVTSASESGEVGSKEKRQWGGGWGGRWGGGEGRWGGGGRWRGEGGEGRWGGRGRWWGRK